MRGLRVAALLIGATLATPATPAAAEIAERKRLLIQELLEISGGARATQQVAQMFLAQLETVYGTLVDQVVRSEGDLTPEQRRALRTHLSDFDAFAVRFREHFPERVDLASVMQEVYTPLYDKYFDEAELDQIVAFYRSPAGRKTITVMPALLQEGIDATLPRVEPKVMELVGEILASRSAEILN